METKGSRKEWQNLDAVAFSKLAKHKYLEWHRRCDDMDTVIDLFWTHPTSMDLLHAFPDVLLTECTYKTNRYRMPLLEIVGVTSTDKTFSIYIAYLQYEREESYAWALGILLHVIGDGALPSVIVTNREIALLKAMQTIFLGATNLLCKWHINRNVLSKCKKLFETKEKWDRFIMSWNVLMSSSSEDHYNYQLNLYLKEFSTYLEALQCISCSWFDPSMERFVAAWTNKFMYFGNSTTNR